MAARRPALVLSLLAGLLAFSAHPATAVTLGGSGYPKHGRAIDQLVPAADYSDVLAERARSDAIMRARAHGFVPSRDLHDYVRGVLLHVLAGVTLPPSFQPDVKVLASPEFSGLSTPDGTIVLTIGLLEQIESEDELAFLLSHEISHAIYRHHASDWWTRSEYYAVMNTSAQSSVSNKDSGLPFGLGNLRIAERIYKLSANVLAPQFQQVQEDQADALGIDLMIKAGYSPEGAETLLGRLQQIEEATDAVVAKEGAAERAELEEEQRTAQADDSGFFSRMGHMAGAALSTLGYGFDKITDATKAHRAAADRIDLIGLYQFREYRGMAPRDLTPLPWRTANGGLAAMLAHYEAADIVADAAAGTNAQSGLVTPKSPREVQDALHESTSTPTVDHAYTEYAASSYYAANHNAVMAKAALMAAVKSPEPSWLAYSALIDDDLKRKDYAAAQAVMADAVVRFNNSPILLPKRIAILRGLGKQDEADKLIGDCTGYDIQELLDQCRRAAGHE